ncbi:MAG: efflux RND transporter permease subunit [Phycisphaerales bacterium]
MNLARFGIRKPVPVNLLMMAIIIGGAYAGLTITREFFPDISPSTVSITLPYPGATPVEVEESMALKVEDAVADLDEVKEIRTSLSEGGGGVVVELRSGVDAQRGLDEIDRAIDGLTDLPAEAEEIQAVAFEPRMPVIMVSLYGQCDEETLKQGIRGIRDDLKTLPEMGEIAISGIRGYELRVDVNYGALLEHGISLPQVAGAIRGWMREVPGGSVRTDGGNINVRTLGVPETAAAIREIVVRAGADGQSLRVGDIAQVREDYVDVQLGRRFNGESAASLVVFKVGDQDAVSMAKMVRAYVDGRNGKQFHATALEHAIGSPRKKAHELGANSTAALPGALATHSDLARFIEQRLNLLSRNAFWGAVLVFALLLIFLNWRVALWVGVGLMTAVCGTLMLMHMTGVTLNLITMFGLIVVLGLLVDDAIVVAENIQTRHEAGEDALEAADAGTNQVFWPVVATVMTSIVAFLPLTFIEGQMGDLIGALPMVVACALSMSLVESVLILPSHMGHSLRGASRVHEGKRMGIFRRFEASRDNIINQRIVPAFGKLLDLSLRYRYVSTAIALATLIGTLGLVAGGRIAFTFLGDSDAETVVIDVRMPIGVAVAETDAIVKVLESAALAQNAGKPENEREVQSVSSVIGERQDLETGSTDVSSSHVAQLFIELAPIEQQNRRPSSEILASIREYTTGRVDAAESIRYSEIGAGPGGADITFEVTGPSLARIDAAVADLAAALRTVPGVFDISDDNFPGQREIQIRLLPSAAALGMTVNDIAQQVRGALYGIDAHVYSERREDIDVRVRLDESTRRDLAAIEDLWIITPTGAAVPLSEIASLDEGSSYAVIRRIDRQRAVTLTADCAPGVNPEDIMREFPLDDIAAAHPGVTILTGGRQRNLADAFATLPIGFAAALIMIYVILAWLFSSYVQPLAVMLAIPFGMIGVVWGHFIIGVDLTFLSLIGFVALSGIVVNDSLILVEFYNHKRAEGLHVRQALVESGMRRLRPIFLTTITTIGGLTPLMLETSFQARFLIPMAVSIAFGLLSATILILMVLPCIIVIMNDIKDIAHFAWHGTPRPAKVRTQA